MKRQLKVKTVCYLIVLTAFAACLLTYGIFAQPTITLWISGGIYPQSHYSVWAEGTNYFGKANTGQLLYESTNFSDIMIDILTALAALSPYTGGNIHISTGNFTVDTRIPVTIRCVIEGEGIGATVLNVEPEINGTFYIAQHVTLRDFRLNMKSNLESTNTTSDIGIYINGEANGEMSMFENLYITRFGIGIYCYRVISYDFFHLEFYNCYESVRIEGASMSAVSDYINFFGGRIAGCRSYPLVVDNAKYINCYGTIFEDYQALTNISLHNFRGVRFIGCHFEAKTTNSTGIYADQDSSDQRESLEVLDCAFDMVNNGYGINIYNVTTVNIERTTVGNVAAGDYFLNVTECEDVRLLSPILDGVIGDLVTGTGVYLESGSASGNETGIVDGSWIAHNMGLYPDVVHLTPRSNVIIWVMNRNTTHFRVGVSAGAIDFDWIAEYIP